MKWSLRSRLIVTFLVLIAVVGAVTLFAIERTMAGDLLKSLDTRLVYEGRGVANWLASEDHQNRVRGGSTGAEDEGRVDRIAMRLGKVTGARITIIGADARIEGDSGGKETIGARVEDTPEIVTARKGDIGRAERSLVEGQSPFYLVAVPAPYGRIVRVAWPLSDVIATRQRMRNRLLVGSILGFIGALALSALALRAVVRPLQSMTRTAAQLAKGNYEIAPPVEAMAAGGELAVLGRSLTHLAGEIKQRIGELTAQRDLLRGVVGTLIEGVIVLDPDANIVIVNDAAELLVGDRGLPPVLAPLVDAALASARDQAYRPPRPGTEAESIRDAEVELRGRAVRATALPLPSGGAIVVLYDVTRLRALEGQSREFLASAAHELRTPVTAIQGSAETLLGGAGDRDTEREFIEVIHRNAQRLAALVSDLLVLEGLGARPEAIGERASIALLPVVDDAISTARAVKPDIDVTVDVAPEIMVMGTRDGLDHIVQNLIDNAVKHGRNAPVTIRAARHGRRVRFAIEDKGPGIPPELQSRVFERFFRVDVGRARSQGGTGLGLAIVKSHVEAIGGTVQVVSTPGDGATFIVELDAVDDEALRREARRTSQKAIPRFPRSSSRG